MDGRELTYDFLGSSFSCKQGQDACAAAHVQHALAGDGGPVGLYRPTIRLCPHLYCSSHAPSAQQTMTAACLVPIRDAVGLYSTLHILHAFHALASSRPPAWLIYSIDTVAMPKHMARASSPSPRPHRHQGPESAQLIISPCPS